MGVSHRPTLMEISQRVVISKTQLWPTNAGTVGETLDAALPFSHQSRAHVSSPAPPPHCELVENIWQKELNPNSGITSCMKEDKRSQKSLKVTPV